MDRAALPVADPVVDAPADMRHVRIESELGVPLREVDLASNGTSTARVPLAPGQVLRLPPTGSFALSAPGHAPRQLEEGADRVVLTPVASHLISGPRLQQRLRQVDVMNLFGPAAAIQANDHATHGYRSPDEWCIAFDRDALLAAYPDTLFLDLLAKSGRAVSIWRNLRYPGDCRTELQSDWLGSDTAASELSISIAGAPRIGKVLIALSVLTDGKPLAHETYDWGTVTVRSGAFQGTRSLEPGASIARFASVPAGLDVVATATADEGRVYGRTRFTHDGAMQTIALVEGAEATFLLRTESGRPVKGTSARVVTFCHDPRSNAASVDQFAWRVERIVDIARSTAVRIAVPGAVPATPLASYPCPANVQLEVKVHGYRPITRTFTAEWGGVTDLGELVLEPSPFTIRLAQECVQDADTTLVLSLVTGVAAGDLRRWEIETTEATEDGAILAALVELRDPGEGDEKADRAVGEPRPMPPALVVQTGSRAQFCTVGRDGVYGCVPRVQCGVRFLSDGPVFMVDYGVTWRGIDVLLGTLRVEGLDGSPVIISAPPGSTELWWETWDTAGGEPNAARATAALVDNMVAPVF